MGRKSKAKQIVRETLQKEEHKLKEKRKKTKKAAKAPKKKTKKKINKNQIFGSVLTLAMLALLVFIGFALFQKVFRPQSIAKFLPEENTLLTLEINSNLDHHQPTKTFNLLQNYPDYTQEGLINYLETTFNANYETDIKPWLGRQIDLALIDQDLVYFTEVYDQTKTLTFLEDRPHVFIENYLFLSENQEALDKLVAFQETSDDRLNSNPRYRKIINNLPVNKTAFFYVNYHKITPEVLQQMSFFDSNQTLLAFLSLLDSEGMALIALDDKFAIQSFLNLNDEKLEGEYLDYQEKYTADLSGLVAADALAFWGGTNLEYQLKRNLEAFASGKTEVLDVFENLLNNYTQKYFGTEISLNRDILPLLNQEFAFAIEQNENDYIYKLIISLEDAASQQATITNIADNFAKMGAVFESQIVEHILPDGTRTREWVAVPKGLIRTEQSYQNRIINEIQIGNNGEGIFYTIMDDSAIISNSLLGVQRSIDLSKGQGESLKTAAAYKNLLSPIIKSSDEIIYLNFEKLLPVLFANSEIPNFLTPISSLSSGKNYFNDGISTINYLQVK